MRFMYVDLEEVVKVYEDVKVRYVLGIYWGIFKMIWEVSLFLLLIIYIFIEKRVFCNCI